MGYTAEVSYDANYAAYVHEGTGRMAGRPFLRQAAERANGIFERDAARIEGTLL